MIYRDQFQAGCPCRRMCSLYLSVTDKIGVHLDRFGDSTERLAEI